MTDLVAVLTTGKGTWAHVSRVMKEENWENIFLITNEFGRENFTSEKKFEFIVVNPEKSLDELKSSMAEELKKRVKSSEIAVNFISGSGKEHMALLSSVLSLGIGVRFIAATEKGIEEV